MFMLDTNTVIYFFKGIGQVGAHLLSTPPRDVCVSTITLFELRVGLAKTRFPQKKVLELNDFVASVQLIPFAGEQASSAAAIRARLEQLGTPIGPYDVLIAGCCLSIGGSLVTHNQREFGRVEGLTLVDWY